MAKLRKTGLIESRQGAGSFGNSGPGDRTSGYGALDPVANISGYFVFRKVIEAEGAARAAQNVQPADIDTLRSIVEGIETRIEAGQATAALDAEFHTSFRCCLTTASLAKP
ncbi:FadR/GntR family transcriptional regulator [Palleronia sp. THAF1]|uniref:FadR/GntR family transcriptional regulator n=1 Tax=Palleronia sp. THAF1 TaxID=2587842 RepID=UPI0020C7B0A6|nr:FCD domain-containing protein [Palleronia sp. THAF1]